MTKQQQVEYRSDENGYYWYENQANWGSYQKDLHHAMNDYERHLRDEATGISTIGEDEEADSDGAQEGAGGIGPGGGGTPAPDPGHGDQDSTGAGSDQDGRSSGTDDGSGSSPAE